MVSQHDQERFEMLYRQHARHVLAYALTRTTRENAHDATANTFLVAWRRFDHVPEDALPWLIGVTRRVLADQWRSEMRRTALSQRLAGLAVAHSSRIDDLPESIVLQRSIRTALTRLRPQDRDLVVLTAWHGFDLEQLAVALDCSKPVASLRLHRARRRFAHLLGAEQDAPSPGRLPHMRPAKEIQ
jgi:RNA polymerase sigma-70 factor (ECF subfamily)